MKTLQDILYRCRITGVSGSTDLPVGGITSDSRKTSPDQVFVAIKGTKTDGHNYINEVISKGVKAIVCEQLPDQKESGVTYIQVKDSTETLAIMAGNFYDNPSAELNLIGITGTNGKTTTATLLFQLFSQAGFKTGLISTVRNMVNSRELPSTHTTPGPLELNDLIRQMVLEGCEYCFMEVSSHAVVQKRIAGLTFKGGVFTNLTHDHLDYHLTFDAYLKAKKSFFDSLSDHAFAITNIDDKNGFVMVQNTRAIIKTMAVKKQADFKCRILENHFDGLQLNINGRDVWCRLVGNFNAYNLLSIYATSLMLGMSEEDSLTGLSKLIPVDGRFEYMKSPLGITGIVDYAHTPDALLNVITTINAIREGNGRLFTVVGAGGNRDKTKRPLMASIAAENSSITILTADNPRDENPDDILDEMISGITPDRKKSTLIISNRKQAIRTACTMAESGDIILVAGKGHETYQEIKGVKHHFDDREELKEALGITDNQ
ncbi:MAG: UDP-N-acetylmuramoyl-L-alanyl-D-glutamate--2,6-diaminopimelate ligase [Lentimicrobium sp.]|nr:UDP-N-acetylmuramoyl-L-alanyl-D-glutamate--2,6-diaminopimelate ligase [Lentimicrobium sp.]